MSDLAIRVEASASGTELGATGGRTTTLRDSLRERVTAPSASAAPRDVRSRRRPEAFWALRGRLVRGRSAARWSGIIGRNGAGKSTLLKILVAHHRADRRRADIHGRVGSLLEVGTGFHPELTGRENIFLNGAILGMRRARDRARSSTRSWRSPRSSEFIDTPVKHYSSGMYMRLAFAVAAHLEPEILLVDEVLAVGDAAFQKKCLGQDGATSAGDGRTVLFVSHNMGAVGSLCSRSST